LSINNTEIAFISADETLPLRSLQLRDGWNLDKCRFDSDEIEGAFHLAHIVEGEVICVLSLHPQDHKDLKGACFQLRGMATHPHFYKKGYGKSLIEFAINELKSRNVDFIWCNAEMPIVFMKKLVFSIFQMNLK
jgi:GNAT superfamily N-acetyltransferase